MKILKHAKGSSLRAVLIRHTGGTFFLKIIGQFLRLGTGVILARALGASGYGVYAFPMAVVALLRIPATVGLPQLLVRNISLYHAGRQYGLMRGVLIRANQFVLLISIIFAAGAASVYFLSGKTEFFSAEGTTFLIAMFLLPIAALNAVRLAALRGLRKVILGQIPELVIRPVLFLVITGSALFFYGKTMSPQLAMTFQIVSAAVAFLVGIVLLLRYQPQGVKQCVSEYRTREWFRSAVPFMFLGVMAVINKQTDIVMLGIMRSSAEVGIYRAVVHGSMFVTFVLSAVNTAQTPQIARLWALGDKQRLQKMITSTARVVAFCTFIVSFVLMIWGKFFLSLFFGEEFAIGVSALRILCAGQIVNGLAGSVGNILNMTGYENKAVQAVVLSAMVNILFNIVLVHRYGINGAAFATALSLVTWNIFMIVCVKINTGLSSTAIGI